MSIEIPAWDPPWEATGPPRFLRVTSPMTRGHGCAEQLARKARPDVYPVARAPREAFPIGSFPLGLVRDAVLLLLAPTTEPGPPAVRIRDAVTRAIADSRDTWAPETSPVVEAGVLGYLEVRESLRASGELPDTVAVADVVLAQEADGERTEFWAWAIHHISRDGAVREVHLLRWQRAAQVSLSDAEAAFVAHVAGSGFVAQSGAKWATPFAPARSLAQPPPATKVRVRVIGLLDGTSDVRFEGTPAQAEQAFLAEVPTTLRLLAGGATSPSGGCRSCNVRHVCAGLPAYPGLLGVAGYSPILRTLSPSDLWTHAACPRQLHLLRDLGLPRERSAPSDALRRGTDIHAWLRLAHDRGEPCRESDLSGGPGVALHHQLGWSDDEAAIRLPYLRQHLALCPLVDAPDTRVLSELEITALDTDANVLFSTRPDGAYLAADGRWVLRETKTLSPRNLPDDPNDLLQRYPQVAAAVCLLADGYRPDAQPADGPGRVELELLGPEAGRVLVFDAADPVTVLVARTALAGRVDAWLFDDQHPIGERPPCASCEVSRWCGQQPAGALEAAAQGLALPEAAEAMGHDWDVHAPEIVLRDLMGVASDDEEFPF